ncbi:MAG: DUF1080 domain-containing protein [Prosthecobacter sp.]
MNAALCIASASILILAQNIWSQEISLFNGRDLEGWEGVKEDWSVQDGSITGTSTAEHPVVSHSWLVSTAPVMNDFELSMQCKVESTGRAGVLKGDIAYRATISGKNFDSLAGYGIALGVGDGVKTAMGNFIESHANKDRTLLAYRGENSVVRRSFHKHTIPDMAFRDGSKATLWWADSAKKETFMTSSEISKMIGANQWLSLRLIVVGNLHRFYINGLLVTEMTDEPRHLSGKIALGLSNELATIQFKDIKLKAHTPTAIASPSSTAPPSTTQTEAGQYRIEVIKDQGPNAAEWALTPLDEAIPADIRQNLTFLREDLLDEGAKAAKASMEAYKLASDYCNKLLAALDQRDLARVEAGYAAAQADANKATSTQALDARRNHQMSWPQFSREESQRAALRESETNKADVKKQRLKVEWATRAEQMRQHLDNIYRQLREAMR